MEATTNYDASKYEEAFFYEPGPYNEWLLKTCIRTWGLEKVEAFLDAGAATGSFTQSIAEAIGCPKEGVLAVEPQESMANVAAERLPARCATLLGYLKSDRPRQAFDAVLIKEVVHLLTDWDETFSLLKTAVKPGGRVLVVGRPARSSMPFFAAAHKAYEACSPNHLDVANALRAAGFSVSAQEFDYEFQMSKEKWFGMLRARFWSNLQGLSDDEMTAGLLELKDLPETLDCTDNLIFITAQAPAESIGAFRDGGVTRVEIPECLAGLRTSDVDLADFRLGPGHHLNHGAFGSAFGACIDLAASLRALAEANPNSFYDDLCLPLMRESREFATEVFHGPCELFPNVTMGLKGVCEAHLAAGVKRVAFLPPLYGSTVTLLKELFSAQEVEFDGGACFVGRGCSSASQVAALTEDMETILAALDRAFAKEKFDLLVADQVASLSGRAIDVDAIVGWAKAKGVRTIIDGTQSPEFELTNWPDTYVVGSQKWLCNVKTCAIVRTEPGSLPPKPCAISFGFGTDPHLWSGCLDYTPFIVLQKALRIHQRHGKALRKQAADLLAANLSKVGLSALPARAGRTLELVKVLRYESDPQQTLNAAGVYASVKRIGTDVYIRVSAYVYNTPEDYEALGDVLNYNHRLDAGVGLTMEDQCVQKRKDILHAFQTTWDLTDALFEQLSNEAFFTRSEPLRHPLIFYFGHVGVFFMNKLVLGTYLGHDERIDQELESLCAVGVDEMSWDDLWLGNWDKVAKKDQAETVSRLRKYRARMRALMSELIIDEERAPLRLPITQHSIFWVIIMGIEHERIHTETSSVILSRMPIHLVNPSSRFPLCPDRARTREDAPTNSLVQVKGGVASIGRKWDGTRFYGWDNEFGTTINKRLEDFEVSQMLVSNAEFLEFVEDGGYANEKYWTAEGWKWVNDPTNGLGNKPKTPLFWMEGKAKLRTVVREIGMPWDWPAEVNNLEAAAFCNWKGAKLGKTVRLLTYPEWFLLRSRATGVYNLNMREFCSTCPVNKFGEALGKNGEQIYDITGNAWQHSCSPLTVLPDFQTHNLYDDFTLPTIDGEHDCILGGSWTSLGNLARDNSRYGFRRHFHQFAAIRYVVSENPHVEIVPPVFEPLLGGLLTEHYLDFDEEVELAVPPVPNGLEVMGKAAAALVKDTDDVLVMQGGPGRITLEILAEHPTCKMVHTDPTAISLDCLLSAKKTGALRWERKLEGQISATECFPLPDSWASALQTATVDVLQLDIYKDLPGRLDRKFDVVVVDLSVLGRTEWPSRGIVPAGLDKCVKDGGKLMVVRPKSLELTGIAGFVESGVRSSLSHIAKDTRRKNTYTISEISVWTRQGESSAGPASVVEAECQVFYDRPSVLKSYRKFHFEDGFAGVRNFPARCAEICLDACRSNKVSLGRALDAGCGPGRMALELAKRFEEVVAFDFATEFVEECRNRAPKNMTAFVADAHKVGEYDQIAARKFDLIVGANLIDRMTDPIEWISQSKQLLSEEGLLVIFSPFTWLEEFTKVDKWLGGYRHDSEVVYTIHGLCRACFPELVLASAPTHVPFVIPDVDGSYQYTSSQLLIFRRKKADDVTSWDVLKQVGLNNGPNKDTSAEQVKAKMSDSDDNIERSNSTDAPSTS
jgi:5-histidylcysteine sulfoxide synthase